MNPLDPALVSESYDAIAKRAAAFFARRRFGGWSERDQTELDAWLAESALHEVAYLRLRAAAARSEKLFALRPFKFGPDASSSDGKIGYRRFVVPLLVAASIALFVAFGIPLANYLMQPPERSLSTDVGGRNLLRFADGTEFELNTDTAIRYRMTNQERTVWLDRGEVWFHVAHDAHNPFAVVVGKHRVTDLGTEFLVRRGSNAFEVALLKGEAALSTEGVQTVALGPGDDAIATPISVAVIRKAPQELADELAWRQGMLVFRNARLSDVVREFNRYNTTKLVIADPSIADKRISVHARTGDYEDFLQLAEVVLKLNIDREGSVILISRGSRNQVKRAVRANREL
jgi:transmembrane sensor